MDSAELPLPYGWVKQVDPSSNHTFYVDTKANPPRSIWVHPYQDEQFLAEHPDVREKVSSNGSSSYPSDDKDSELPAYERHESKEVHEKKEPEQHEKHDFAANNDHANMADDPKGKKKEKRGFFDKLKDKTIGTKEERELAKQEAARMKEERRRAEAEYERQYYAQQGGFQQWGPGPSNGYSGHGYGPSGHQPHFAPPQSNYYGPGPGPHGYMQPGGQAMMYGPAGGQPMMYGPPGGQPMYHHPPPQAMMYGPPQRQGGGSSMAVPILGGLAGGLLLGSLVDF